MDTRRSCLSGGAVSRTKWRTLHRLARINPGHCTPQGRAQAGFLVHLSTVNFSEGHACAEAETSIADEPAAAMLLIADPHQGTGHGIGQIGALRHDGQVLIDGIAQRAVELTVMIGEYRQRVAVGHA